MVAHQVEPVSSSDHGGMVSVGEHPRHGPTRPASVRAGLYPVDPPCLPVIHGHRNRDRMDTVALWPGRRAGLKSSSHTVERRNIAMNHAGGD